MKEKYVTPQISSQFVDLENEISLGSANINNGNNQNEIFEEWQTDSTTTIIDW